jgi:DNA-binding NtrC family response regulator
MVGSLGGIKGAYIACLGVTDERGLAILQGWREREPELPVIAFGPASISERALTNGAYGVVPSDAPATRLVQEIKHAVEKRRLAETVTKLRTELTARDHGEGNVVVPLRELEHRAIARALQATEGSVTKAAKLLGIGRATLYRRLASPELANLRPRRNNNNNNYTAAESQPVHASM